VRMFMLCSLLHGWARAAWPQGVIYTHSATHGDFEMGFSWLYTGETSFPDRNNW